MSSPIESSMIWTQPETISNRFRNWSQSIPNWETAEFCRERTLRFLHRMNSLRQRLGMPLIVAMLGGTGTGKSTLLNALLGEHIVEEGKERPTTAKPILVCHHTINPETWGIDLSGIQIEKRDLPALEQMVILDCPDPDTTENDDLRETNLARLRAVLPLCDVLLVTATQQKYRSRRVLDELATAAPGARLVFVQTHADRDTDIRDDWNELLKKDYETGRIFFIDSVAALKSQQNKTPLPKEFTDLQQLLTVNLNEEAAIRIRQANFFSLAEETADDCRREIIDHWAAVGKLRDRISEERRLFGERLSEKMRNELIRDRRLWESRLLGRVATQWGYSPFSILLRIYQGCGGILSGALLTRVRSVPQLAVWGAFEGIRSLRNWSNSHKMKKPPAVSILANWEENRLRESALVLIGFASDAKIPTEFCTPDFILNESKQAGKAFINSIAGELEAICERLANRNNRWWVRIIYEMLFGGMIFFLLLRPAKNFFIDTFFDKNVRFYGTDFYLISVFWLIVWGILLLGLFTFTLRRGLNREINETSAQWERLPALDKLFGAIEKETNRIIAYRDELETIYQRLERINQQAEKLDRRLGRKK
ncbi:MAG: dynamin family protein [Planctomycetaceae bacterium]|nr:dynamin family protein [Planctomycetaceae bacterium]